MGDDLRIAEITVDEGPTLKRWRARARGRIARIKKRTCHITVKVAAPETNGATPARPKQQTTTPDQPSKPKRQRSRTPRAEKSTSTPRQASARAPQPARRTQKKGS